MSTTTLPVSALRVWPGNPRKTVDPEALDELTASVRSLKGVKTPLLVRALATPEGAVTHEVLAGQRRLLAARAAELAEVPVSVEDLDDASALELALSENGSRRDASPLEDAEAVERLITEHGRSVDRAARVIGRSVRWVERRRSLLRLVPDARAWLSSGELPTGHAEARDAAASDVLTLVAEVERLRAQDNPALDATDGAHPAWWRGHDYVTERWRERVAAVEAERDALRAVVDRARELVAASRHTDDCAASHHQHCGAECDYDDSTPEECARAYREGCECGLRELCDALGVEVDRG